MRATNPVDDTEELIANMPEINNDSMVGDLNQLINDLNSGGKNSARGPQPVRQLSASRRPHNKDSDNDSVDAQAKAMYFDLGSNAANVPPRSVDYIGE